MWERKVPGIQFGMFHVFINSWEIIHTEAIVLPVQVREVELARSDCALPAQHKN